MATYRITQSRPSNLDGVEFEVPDGEWSEEELAEFAALAVAEYLSYGWEKVSDAKSEADQARKARRKHGDS